MRTSRKLIGKIGVDSGTIVVGDPCYIDEVLCEVDQDFGLFTVATDEVLQAQDALYGAVVRTGLGDGIYPVYATVAEVEDVEVYITKLEIVFLED